MARNVALALAVVLLVAGGIALAARPAADAGADLRQVPDDIAAMRVLIEQQVELSAGLLEAITATNDLAARLVTLTDALNDRAARLDTQADDGLAQMRELRELARQMLAELREIRRSMPTAGDPVPG